MQSLDLALQREFAVTETVKFQIRAEAFNALNHTNPGTPNRFGEYATVWHDHRSGDARTARFSSACGFLSELFSYRTL